MGMNLRRIKRAIMWVISTIFKDLKVFNPGTCIYAIKAKTGTISTNLFCNCSTKLPKKPTLSKFFSKPRHILFLIFNSRFVCTLGTAQIISCSMSLGEPHLNCFQILKCGYLQYKNLTSWNIKILKIGSVIFVKLRAVCYYEGPWTILNLGN